MEAIMPRRKTEDADPIGPIVEANLIRLGYAETVVKTTEIAELVSTKTGRPMSRQRVANILNAVRVNPATIDLLAEGLGVKPEELTRKPRK
jgi:hypothetical protein